MKLMKIIVIGCGAIGSTCLSQIESQGHDVAIIENLNHKEEVKGDLKNLLLERQAYILTDIYQLMDSLVREEEPTHADFLLMISLEGRKVHGLYGKVSPMRGVLYR